MTPIKSAMRITPPFSDARSERNRAPTAGKRGPAIGGLARLSAFATVTLY
jgi:hypothetical protein